MGGNSDYAHFDSMAVEANGNICVAMLVKGGIMVFSPKEFHEAPEGYCTNICFGGEDMRTAYITLSGYGTLLATKWSRLGLRLVY
jgi:gluconolactonase